MKCYWLTLCFCLACFDAAYAQTPVYVRQGDPWQAAMYRWKASSSALAPAPPRPGAKPVLLGMRSVPVELLEDSVLRKHPKIQGQRSLARHYIRDVYLKGQGGRNDLHGKMAEALFLNKHSEWGYVKSPNDPHYDVTRAVAGQPPLNGQIKFHTSGKASAYARDMRKDSQAQRFIVPDDHLPALRDYWLKNQAAALRRGDLVAAHLAEYNAGRLEPLGATSQQITETTKEAFQQTAAESRAAYFSLAAGLSLSLGQIAWDFAEGKISADQAEYRAAKTMALMGTGLAADFGLQFFKQGALRGTLQGNLIVGAITLVVETSWNIHKHGGLAAFRHPEFYEQLGGSVSAVGIGGVAGFYIGTCTSEFGPMVAVPAGLLGGTVVGTLSYLGGRSATHWLLHTLTPDMYLKQESQEIAAVKQHLAFQLERARQLPP